MSDQTKARAMSWYMIAEPCKGPTKLRAPERITAAAYKATESEASVEARVTQWLTERGYNVHPLVSEVERGYRGKSRRNPPGTPDLIAVGPWEATLGFLPSKLYLEMKKAKGGRHSAEQVAMQAKLRAQGFCVFAHRSDGTDVIEQLDAWAKGGFK